MGNKLLVFQSDFSLNDGAVSAMYGVSYGIDPTLTISNLTHHIPQFNIWEGSYRLLQTVQYWPKETVFVSIVDPGVGSDRIALVVKTVGGQYIVTPNNGTLTHIKKYYGIDEARIINEEEHRLPNSGESHTFHGRDIFAYTGAKLASGVITYEEVGPVFNIEKITELPLIESRQQGEMVIGSIDIVDKPFGNLWTNISRKQFLTIASTYGDQFELSIKTDGRNVYKNIVTYERSFADLHIGEPLVYVNSLDNLGVAINQGSFANAYRIESGTNWEVTIRKATKIIYS